MLLAQIKANYSSGAESSSSSEDDQDQETTKKYKDDDEDASKANGNLTPLVKHGVSMMCVF